MAGIVGLQCDLSNRFTLAHQESQVKLLVRVAAPSARAARTPLNLCLAIDRSFSMQDDHKLERAKEAANALVDALEPTDIFSLVEFGTDVRVALEAQPVSSPERLKQAISAIQARSATNLHDALHAAGATVYRGYDPTRVNRVILLSDGVPTEGVTDEEAILEVARSAARLGISITTLGLGYDYDEVLLSRISEISRGNHYYIERAGDIALILRRELTRMESIVARGLKLHLRVPEGWQVEQANQRYRGRTSIDPGGCAVELDDLECGGSQLLAFALLVAPGETDTEKSAIVSLEYQDTETTTASTGAASTEVASTGAAQAVRCDAAITLTLDTEKIRAGINRDVLRQWEELDSMQAISTAVERGAVGAMSAAQVLDVIQRRTQRLRQAGSEKTTLLERIGQKISTERRVGPEVAKRTVVERVQTQQRG